MAPQTASAAQIEGDGECSGMSLGHSEQPLGLVQPLNAARRPGDGAHLQSMRSTAELSRRPARAPDHEAENRALIALARDLAISPEGILQKLVDAALVLCRAHSAGISLLEDSDHRSNFHWRAIAGVWAPQLNGGTPRNFGPCGTVLDRNLALMCSHPERDFPYFGAVLPLLDEGLLVPFYVKGEAVGTIWVVAHDESRRFDAEDLRVLTNLGTFASAAYQAWLAAEAAAKAQREVQQSLSALRDSEHRLHAVLDALPAAVYTTDADGRVTYYNQAAVELSGRRPELGSDEWCVTWRLFSADGTPMRHDECPMAQALKQDRPIRGIEAVAERPDGTRVPFVPYPTPLHDASGKLIGAVNMLVDITERKRAEDQQTLMVRELHHRVKNTLATVQAIMGSTARSSETIEDFKTALTGRIGSLARTHLLLADEAQAVDFTEILRSELTAFDDGSGKRILISGPTVEISARLAVALGMAIHELTTNAAKHGALSVYGGRVEASWRVTIEATRRTLDFDWVESGGPAVAEPARTGFGTRLLEIVLPGQVQAKTRIVYASEGVRVHYEVPLPALPA